MREPIVLCEGEDLVFFRTAKEAASYLEPWYVESEDFQVYDSDGNVLCVTTDGRQVAITDAPTPNPRSHELTSRVRDFLLSCRSHAPAQVQSAALAELLAMGLVGRGDGAG